MFAVRAALDTRYRAMVDVGAGCGLRQGEIFGLPVENINVATGWIHVGNQVKLVNGRMVFAPPKRGKERDVPLPDRVASALRAHLDEFPPSRVTLPWLRPDGPTVTRELVFTRERGTAVRGTDFNVYFWKPALVDVGLISDPEKGRRYVSAREHGMHW